MNYNHQVAVKCARLIKDRASTKGLKIISKNIEALVCHYESGVYVIFAELTDMADTLMALDHCYCFIPLGHAHYGFTEAFSLIASELGKVIQSLNPSFPVYFTGFSMGGVLALQAQNYYNCNSQCYAFGIPRLYDYSAALNYNTRNLGNVFCFSHIYDPISYYPTFGYRPVGQQFEIVNGFCHHTQGLIIGVLRLISTQHSLPLLNTITAIIIGIGLTLGLKQFHSIQWYLPSEVSDENQTQP